MNKRIVCIHKVLKIYYRIQIIEIGIATVQIKLVAILENGHLGHFVCIPRF